VECRWKVVVLRARRWSSRWIWRQVRRGERCGCRWREAVVPSMSVLLMLSLLLLSLRVRLFDELHCGGCWRVSKRRPFANGDSTHGTVGIVVLFTGGTKTSA
jgi:hypothetical protein